MSTTRKSKPISKKQLVSRIYSHQVSKSKQRGHKPPTYTLIDLTEWLNSQKRFHELYDNWVTSGYLVKLVPSVDRLDDAKGYSLSNIRVVTWEANNLKGKALMRKGIIINSRNPQRPIIQYDLDGKKIREYVSLCEAQRATGINRGAIFATCNGKADRAGDFVFKYKYTNKNEIYKIKQKPSVFDMYNCADYTSFLAELLDAPQNLLTQKVVQKCNTV